jgi:hypothetical protein
MIERCALCNCILTRGNFYAKPTIEGRAHAKEHHYIAERFFGRSANRPSKQREPILAEDPWEMECKTGIFCYECHEELLHNPVFLPEDIQRFRYLVHLRGLGEENKTESREKIAGRIQLLHEIIERGICRTLEIEEEKHDCNARSN